MPNAYKHEDNYSLPISVTELNRLELGMFRRIPKEDLVRLMGDGFANITDSSYVLDNTSGLCGILCVHASGILTAPSLWRDVNYDIYRYKQIFDDCIESQTNGPKGFEYFEKDFAHLGANDYDLTCVTTGQELQDHLEGLHPSRGSGIAILARFPDLGGIHTHWLACRQMDLTRRDRACLIGDLTPFGITDTFGIELGIDRIANLMANVVSTTDISILPQLSNDTHISNRVFVKNLITNNFINH